MNESTADLRAPIGGPPAKRARAQGVRVSDAEYAELRGRVQSAGLLERAYGYYWARSTLTYGMLAAAIVLMFVLPPTRGWSLVAGVCFGFAAMQVSFLGHDAGHLAMFKSARANFAAGLVTMSLTLGTSFWYWCNRHNLHHSHTNDVQVDPDIQGGGLLIYTDGQAAATRGWRRFVARNQGKFSAVVAFLLFVIIFWVKAESWVYVLTRLRGSRQRQELVLLASNLILSFAPMLVLGWHWFHMWLIGQMFASLYFSLIIATNHKGMPIWATGAPLSFVERQVLSSRNVTAHPVWDFLFGGLNYQIEHHLFPTMPRCKLNRARDLIKPFCLAHGLEYEELNPLASYRAILVEAERVGQSAA